MCHSTCPSNDSTFAPVGRFPYTWLELCGIANPPFTAVKLSLLFPEFGSLFRCCDNIESSAKSVRLAMFTPCIRRYNPSGGIRLFPLIDVIVDSTAFDGNPPCRSPMYEYPSTRYCGSANVHNPSTFCDGFPGQYKIRRAPSGRNEFVFPTALIIRSAVAGPTSQYQFTTPPPA